MGRSSPDYFRRLRAERQAAGLCTRCGGPKPCGCRYASVKQWRQEHPAAYREQSAERMQGRREQLTDDYIAGLLRQMGIAEPTPELIAMERLRVIALRHAGKYGKKKKRTSK